MIGRGRSGLGQDPQVAELDDADLKPFDCRKSLETRVAEMLRDAGLRPTRQRMTLGALLFKDGDRHVSAEALHVEVRAAGERVSLATVYNTLHQFKQAGLIREVAIGGARTFFDTNTSNHNHFYIERDGRVVDIPSEGVRVDGLPSPPEGLRISHIDVVVRLVEDERKGPKRRAT